MKAAVLNGLIGVTLTVLISVKILSLSFLEMGLSILAANCAGLLALLVTLQLEKYLEKIKKTWLRGNKRIWFFLCFIYVLILLSLIPALRDFKTFIVLLIPLILSSGFSTLLFGPVQDRLIWREQGQQKPKRKQKKV